LLGILEKRTAIMPEMVVQEWVESEAGWGTSFDGYSIHRDSADRDEYVKEYWESMPDEVPSVYSRPFGPPRIMHIWAEAADKVYATKNGWRTWDRTIVGE
jgi:hypothetical protein